jgi:ubiquinone biosynthesis protein UbiJ
MAWWGPVQAGALRIVEAALNRLLDVDPDTPARLRPLAGRTLLVEVTDLGVSVWAAFTEEGLRLAPADENDAQPTASVHASVAGLMTLVTSRGRRSRDVSFHGDVGVIQEARQLFSELDLDWEEQLAAITGDVLAHRIGESVRGAQDWAKRSGDTFLRNLGEYLTEERRDLPAAAEVGAFMSDVDRLREDLDRLEARIRRLNRRLGDGEAS